MRDPKPINHPFIEGFAIGAVMIIALMLALRHPGPAHDPISPDGAFMQASR